MAKQKSKLSGMRKPSKSYKPAKNAGQSKVGKNKRRIQSKKR